MEELLKSLQELLAIESVARRDQEKPFGNGVAQALDYTLSLCQRMGFHTKNADGLYGYAEIGEGAEIIGCLGHLDVVPGGDYIISRATFPAYFLQGDPEQARCDLELTLFGKRIAPALGITRRFVGQEPYSPVTARYNQRMQALLPQWGIRVEEIPRLEGISASRVRQLLRQGRLAELQPLVPETTYAYCRDHFGAGAPCP